MRLLCLGTWPIEQCCCCLLDNKQKPNNETVAGNREKNPFAAASTPNSSVDAKSTTFMWNMQMSVLHVVFAFSYCYKLPPRDYVAPILWRPRLFCAKPIYTIAIPNLNGAHCTAQGRRCDEMNLHQILINNGHALSTACDWCYYSFAFVLFLCRETQRKI